MERQLFEFDSLEESVKKLLRESLRSRDAAYAPYSNFHVGAALQCDNGTIYNGCNVENSSYGLTICAERVAITKAISERNENFTSISVCAELNGEFVTPCGACRQFLAEFDNNHQSITVYLVTPKLDYVMVTTLKDLLPSLFRF